MGWARTDTCVEECIVCEDRGTWFLYDEDAVVLEWLCDSCYEGYKED